MQCNAMQCNAMQCNAMQCNARQGKARQGNAMQCKSAFQKSLKKALEVFKEGFRSNNYSIFIQFYSKK
jgi:hypothetical protein